MRLFALQHNPVVQLASAPVAYPIRNIKPEDTGHLKQLRYSLGSKWKSDKCKTLSLFPLGVFGGGRGYGLGLENQPVRFKGGVAGVGHMLKKFSHKAWQLQTKMSPQRKLQFLFSYLAVKTANVGIGDHLRDD